MTDVRIASLVEGDGEEQAFPVLLRRIVYEIDPLAVPIIPRAYKHPSGSLKKDGGLERALNAVASTYPGHSIAVLIDCDDDCPKVAGPVLAQRAQQARPDLCVSVVLPYREYESWFLAGAESLSGKRTLQLDLVAPERIEDIRDAKGWLKKRSSGFSRYSPTQDQAAFSQLMDLEQVRTRSRSFRKLWREIFALVQKAQGKAS